MIKWPNDLINAIARRQCVLYLGSGVSANSQNASGKRPPMWKHFLELLIDEYPDQIDGKKTIIKKLLKHGDYITACEIIVDSIGKQKFGSFVEQEFRRAAYKPAPIHEILFSLDSKYVITPNIDKIYESYVARESNGTCVVKKYYEDIAPYLRKTDYLIIKAHGCVDEIDNMIFTREQYNRARAQYSAFYKLLSALLLTNTFVFVGCGINDPDIQLLLENHNFGFPGCLPHYFITDKKSIHSDVAKSVQKNRNLEFLFYNNTSGTHNELTGELEELLKKVDIERQVIASLTSW